MIHGVRTFPGARVAPIDVYKRRVLRPKVAAPQSVRKRSGTCWRGTTELLEQEWGCDGLELWLNSPETDQGQSENQLQCQGDKRERNAMGILPIRRRRE